MIVPSVQPSKPESQAEGVVIDLARARWLRQRRRFADQSPHTPSLRPAPDRSGPDGAA